LNEGIPLSSFSLQLGASLSGDGASITFAGQECGFVVFGPYLPFKIGLYTFVVEVLFPSHLAPQAFVDIYGGGVVFASQRITTHCNKIRIQAYVSADCKLEVRLHSDRTPVEIKRVTYVSGPDAGAPSMARKQLRSMLVPLLNADRTMDVPQEWGDPGIVASALFGENQFQIVPIQSLYEYESLFRQAGVMPAVIQAFFDQNNRLLAATSGDLVDGAPKLTNAFQQGIVTSGCLELVSPYDGSVIRTQNSIPVPISRTVLSIVYEFQGENPIVVGVGIGWTGAASFIWLVNHDIIVHVDVGAVDWSGPEQVISQYLAFCVKHAHQISDYRGATHTLALAAGFNGNMGHYFWNEVSGLERMIRLTKLTGVETIYSPKSKWLSMKEIFATDQLPPVVELDEWGQLCGEILSRNQILVHPTGTQFDDGLALKVKRAAETRFSAEAPERCRNATDVSSKRKYVLYINLRSHDKAWFEQDKGIVEVIRALRSVYEGDIVVYLDGMADCKESAEMIASHPMDGVAYVMGLMGLHAGFPETLHWAFRCDFFVAVIGSGLVPLTWIANKPGICYGDLFHLPQMERWQDVRNNAAPVGWPAADQVREVRSQAYANYSIDPANMVNLFLETWRRRYNRRGL
jgi:hypothetical protein